LKDKRAVSPLIKVLAEGRGSARERPGPWGRSGDVSAIPHLVKLIRQLKPKAAPKAEPKGAKKPAAKATKKQQAKTNGDAEKNTDLEGGPLRHRLPGNPEGR